MIVSKISLLALPTGLLIISLYFLFIHQKTNGPLIKPQVEGIETIQGDLTVLKVKDSFDPVITNSVIKNEIPTIPPIPTVQNIKVILTTAPIPTKVIVASSPTPSISTSTPTPNKRSWTGKVMIAYFNNAEQTELKVMFIDEFWQKVKDFIYPGQKIRVTNDLNKKSEILTVIYDKSYKQDCEEDKFHDMHPCTETENAKGLIYSSHIVRFEKIETVFDFNKSDTQKNIIDLSFQEI